MLVRKAEQKDLDSIVEIVQSSGYPLMKYANTREQLKGKLADIMVLDVKGKVVGYYWNKGPYKDGLELDSIEVRGGSQGKGYGSALMKDFEGRARRNGYRNAYLKVWNGNIKAIDFYHFNGFRVVDVDLKHYSGGEIALTMCKEL
jgi:ribosomal protein S18 acetylase RimI-like enzyme